MSYFGDIGFDNKENFRGTSISSKVVSNEGLGAGDDFKKLLSDITKKTTESIQTNPFSVLNSSENSDENDGSNFTKYVDAQYTKEQMSVSFASNSQNVSSLQQLIVKFFNFDGQVLSQAGVQHVDVDYLKHTRLNLESKSLQKNIVKEYESMSLSFLNMVKQVPDKEKFKASQNYKAVQYVLSSIYDRFMMFDLPEKVTELSEKANEIDPSLLESTSSISPPDEVEIA